MIIKIASFFDRKSERDAAYKAIQPFLFGDDNGVSGPDAEDEDPQWQLWATTDDLDIDKIAVILGGYSCLRAANGEVIDAEMGPAKTDIRWWQRIFKGD